VLSSGVLSSRVLSSGVLSSVVLSSGVLSSVVLSSGVLSSGVVIWCCHLVLTSDVTRSPFYLFIENFIHSVQYSILVPSESKLIIMLSEIQKKFKNVPSDKNPTVVMLLKRYAYIFYKIK
jgi:hypothetical protein